MNQKQINKNRMYFAVDKVLTDSSQLFAQLEELISVHSMLKTHLDVIDNYRQVQELDNTGMTAKKQNLRQVLMQEVLRIIAALGAYALVSKNEELKVQSRYSPSSLATKSDQVFSDIAKLLHGLATPLIGDLEKYFLTPENLEETANLITQFKLAIPQKRVASGVSKVSTKNIKETTRAIDLLLKESIDVLMLPFQFPHPDFYNAYKNARTIVDYGSGRSKAQLQETLVSE